MLNMRSKYSRSLKLIFLKEFFGNCCDARFASFTVVWNLARNAGNITDQQ